MPAAQHQDLTIFSIDDDAVPLAGYGTVDGSGNITEATFSTDPVHPRPYLKYVRDIGDSSVDYLAGGSTIGQMGIEVLDKRRDANDKDSGLFTYIAATAGGDTSLLGVRVVFRVQRSDSTWEIVFDGVIGPITMTKLTTFRIQIRDPRERERGMKLFTRATDTCLFPAVGPKEGFGYHTEYDATIGHVKVGDPVMPRIKGVLGKYNDFTTFDSGGIIASVWGGVTIDFSLDTEEYATLLKKWGEFTVVGEGAFLGTFILRAFDVSVEWSTSGDAGTFTRLDNMVFGGFLSPTNVFDIRERSPGKYHVRAVAMSFPSGAARPANGSNIWVRVVSNRTPTDEVPLYIEEPFGALLKRVYDAEYTKANTATPIRYDAAQMDVMVRSTEMARGRVTGVADDARQWVQEHVYRVAGWAPAIRSGCVYPIKYEIPDASAPL